MSESSVKCVEIIKQVKGKTKETDNEVRRKYFRMRFKIKKETCELDLQIDQGQWKSFRKTADKDKDFKCFIEVSKVSMSLLKLGKHCLKPKPLEVRKYNSVVTYCSFICTG